MFDKIALLKEKGYTPDTILDIGAYHGDWTHNMLKIYDKSKYHLFEAIDYIELQQINKPNISIHNVLLNDKKTIVDWYEMRNTGDSMYRELTHHFENCIANKRESIDLNSYIINNNILISGNNIMIKIDCQGAELAILKGATNILKHTNFMIIEMPLFGQYNMNVPTFQEHIVYMNSIGFIPYDILSNHYINNFNMQVDMLFINKHHPFNKIVNNNILFKTLYMSS